MLRNLDRISPLSDEIISFLNDLAANKKVEKIIVFGSRALGDYEPYSDLDLAIDAPTMEEIEWLKLREFVIYDLPAYIRISIVDYSTNPIKLRQNIVKTGVVIYDK